MGWVSERFLAWIWARFSVVWVSGVHAHVRRFGKVSHQQPTGDTGSNNYNHTDNDNDQQSNNAHNNHYDWPEFYASSRLSSCQWSHFVAFLAKLPQRLRGVDYSGLWGGYLGYSGLATGNKWWTRVLLALARKI